MLVLWWHNQMCNNLDQWLSIDISVTAPSSFSFLPTFTAPLFLFSLPCLSLSFWLSSFVLSLSCFLYSVNLFLPLIPFPLHSRYPFLLLPSPYLLPPSLVLPVFMTLSLTIIPSPSVHPSPSLCPNLPLISRLSSPPTFNPARQWPGDRHYLATLHLQLHCWPSE